MRGAIIRAMAELQPMAPAAPAQPLSKTIPGILVGTALLGCLFFLLERLFPEQPGQPAIRE